MNLDDDLLTLWLKGDGLTNDEVRDLVERLQEARDEISALEDVGTKNTDAAYETGYEDAKSESAAKAEHDKQVAYDDGFADGRMEAYAAADAEDRAKTED